MSINFKGLFGLAWSLIMLISCYLQNWDIPGLFVIISTASFFFFIIYCQTVKEEDDYEEDAREFLKAAEPSVHISFLLCAISLFLDLEGFWPWTLVLHLCLFIGVIFPFLTVSYMIYKDNKIRFNLLGFFGIILSLVMGFIIFVKYDWIMHNDGDTLLLNPKAPWLFIIISTILFLGTLTVFSNDIRENFNLRKIVSIFLCYFMCISSITLDLTGFWSWVGIFIVCIVSGIGIPFLLIKAKE